MMNAAQSLPVNHFICDGCGLAKPYGATYGEHTTGYAILYGHRLCYMCCAWHDIGTMLVIQPDNTGPQPPALYYAPLTRTVINWPGTLRMDVLAIRHGRHNMAGRVMTVYFRGPAGSLWSGRSFPGDDLLRQVRRVKSIRGTSFVASKDVERQAQIVRIFRATFANIFDNNRVLVQTDAEKQADEENDT